MTNKGTFIINGCERVVVNQIVRGTGIFFTREKRKCEEQINGEILQNSHEVCLGTIIPKAGPWVTLELDERNILRCQVDEDKENNVSIYRFLRVMNTSSAEVLGNVKHNFLLDKIINKTEKDIHNTSKKENMTVFQLNNDEISISKLLSKEFVLCQLAEVEQRENKSESYTGIELEEKPAYPSSERMYEPGVNDDEFISDKIIQLRQLFLPHLFDLGEIGRKKINRKFNLKLPLNSRMLTFQDICVLLDGLIDIKFFDLPIDDIDSLKNRRLRGVGEWLQMQFHIGLTKLELEIHGKLTASPIVISYPKMLFSSKILNSVLKEFFASSQLSQFMDQINPLSALIHKRRVSSLGPGGLSRDRVIFSARDIHPSHYGRLCPLETPEGKNAGLVLSLASYARVNSDGFIETPYRYVKNGQIELDKPIVYLTAEEESQFKVLSADVSIDKNNNILDDIVTLKFNDTFIDSPVDETDLIAISTIQPISPATALIPFIEHNDANRALMGSNMQRQAVPLLKPSVPYVGTGLEARLASNSGSLVISYTTGLITRVESNRISILGSDNIEVTYYLQKYQRSNQETCINQKPIVWVGERVEAGQVIADGPGSLNGELALGQNLSLAYTSWEGYNFEDAIIINERLVYQDLFTSIHIDKYEVEVKQTKNGIEQLTNQLGETETENLDYLDERGLIYPGMFVQSGQVLVGKITPQAQSNRLAEGRLIKAIWGDRPDEYINSSLRLPKGTSGRVLDVITVKRSKKDKLAPGVIELVRVFVGQIRKIRVGDKLAGRHGNKGVISKIATRQDLPYFEDGTPVDLIFNPHGIPSRMNVGQLYECILGLAASQLKQNFKVFPFDERYGDQASRIFVNSKLEQTSKLLNKRWLFNPYSPGKLLLRHGHTGEEFHNPIFAGNAYILKLIHLVEEKVHARSTGPYSLITQQPLGGKSQHGGQRFGEMEVWALQAYGAAYTLQELLVTKSDDLQGRNEIFAAIIRQEQIPKPGVPESLRVIIRELQSLGLDIAAYKFSTSNSSDSKSSMSEVQLGQSFEEILQEVFYARQART